MPLGFPCHAVTSVCLLLPSHAAILQFQLDSVTPQVLRPPMPAPPGSTMTGVVACRYYHVFKRINKQLPSLTTLELQYVSPALVRAEVCAYQQ